MKTQAPKSVDKVAVCSRSFSNHNLLKKELLAKYEKVTFNDSGLQLEGESLIEFLRGHSKAITALEKIDEGVLSLLPDLTVVSKYGVGLDMLDLHAFARRNVKLGWTSGVNRRAVAELALSFSLLLLRRTIPSLNSLLRGEWKQFPGTQLSGKVVGIIGCGNIGKDLVTLLKPFGCKVLVHDIEIYREFYEEYCIREVNLDELLSISDVVSLHVPFTRLTNNMINADKLGLMKNDAVLINTSRGNIVDEVALKAALTEQWIAGAALDVYSNEPPQDQELLSLPNFIGTPHIGGSTVEAVLAMGRAAIHGLEVNTVPDPALLG